jgi:hypothetical protein
LAYRRTRQPGAVGWVISHAPDRSHRRQHAAFRGASPQHAYSIGSWARAQSWRHVEANAPQRPGQRPVAEPVPRSTKIDDEIEFSGEPD